jgi:hypothetical protein
VTAAVYGLTVVAVNERHFKDFGVAFMFSAHKMNNKMNDKINSSHVTALRGSAAAISSSAPDKLRGLCGLASPFAFARQAALD